jgi:DAK2 domain fusion protein YloV
VRREEGPVLDVPAVRAWCLDALDALGRAREEIDALNVFPVPDGDTGTNLFLTLEAAAAALDDRPDDDLPAALRALTQGALLGARGNSGVILSQLGRGAVAALGPQPSAAVAADAAEALRSAFERAADAGYAAVARPVEGTILSVVRAAAAAARATDGPDVRVVVRSAVSAAHEALARTPDQLEALRLAGVVDAGGRGLTVLLDVLLATVTGERPATPQRRAAVPQPRPATQRPGDGPGYEVMYLLDAGDQAVDQLRVELAALGDSLLVVGGDGLWNVHVHVDDVGAAVEAGVRAGRPYRIRVTRFADQPTRERVPVAGRAVLALLPDGGLADLARSVGALVVPSTVGRPPATSDVVEALTAAHAEEVVVVPNARDARAVAHAAADWVRAGGLRVAVLPTRASVQVLAALAVHDAGRRFDDDVIAMTAAARATRTGSVTLAVREALTSAGVCRPGDVLGVIDEDVVVIGADLGEVGWSVLERLLGGGGELVTVVSSPGTGEQAQRLAARLRRTRPDVEVVIHAGAPETYPLLLGVE